MNNVRRTIFLDIMFMHVYLAADMTQTHHLMKFCNMLEFLSISCQIRLDACDTERWLTSPQDT